MTNIWRTMLLVLATAVSIAGCVREEEALTDNQSPPIGGGGNTGGTGTPIPLQLTAPADMQAEATAALTMLNLGQPAATGGDGVYNISSDAPAGGFALGATMVTWSVTDGAAAQASGLQSVTVSDTTAPSLVKPADIQMSSATAPVTVNLGAATATDLVDPNPVVSNDMPAGGFPLGTTAVMWSAVDASGNATIAAQMVTVAPATGGPLVLTAPGPLTLEATGPATQVMLGAAMAGGGQGQMSIVNDAPINGFTVGTTTVTWMVTDSTMATATATQVVTVSDTTAPSITAPADVTGDQGPALGSTTVNLGSAIASDIADLNVTISNNAPANGFAPGTATVIWTAQDASGNTATAGQTVTINPYVAELCSAMVPEFVNTIYPLLDSTNPLTCNGCHTGATPLQTANGFAFPNAPPTAIDFDLFRAIASIDSGGQSLILVKMTGGAGHVGGDRFPDRENDPNYVLLADFIGRAASCQEDPPVNSVTINLGTGYEQLHKITSVLAARTPTNAEQAAVQGLTDQPAIDSALNPIVDGLMNEEMFYTRVEEIYNDLLLTNRDADDRGSVDGNYDLDAFANRDYFEDNFSGNERSDLREDTNYGISRAPVELIRYVVENNRPFTEIVTADYTMINPYSAVIYSHNAGDANFPFTADQIRANHDRDDFRPVNDLRQQDGTLVPAAGVIGTHAFLARYPSTNTNVNRARARYVFDYFLGLNIESLAARDGLNLDSVIGSVPTYEDPQCTVCHVVMDPIAGLFTNRDNGGEYDTSNTFQHTRTTNGVPRMVPAGYTLNPADELPNGQEDTALAWLGMRLAQDDRFADRTVRTVLAGLTGVEGTAPTTTAFINQVKNRFANSNFNFKLLVKDIVMSDYFRAANLSAQEDPNSYADIGSGRLITAEELDRKITSVTGVNYQWRGPNSNSGLSGRHYMLYGGIDSDEVIVRTSEPNSLIDGIQERIANQVSCQRVADDLYNGGTLFPFADQTDVPDGGNGDNAIRQNIQFLHRQLLGEDLALNDPEIGNTYQLFVDVRATGETAIPSQCRGGGGSTDTNGTVIPWMAVVTYLLTDYRFVYE